MAEVAELTDEVVRQALALTSSGEVLTVFLAGDSSDPGRLALEVRAERERLLRTVAGTVDDDQLDAALAAVTEMADEAGRQRPARMRSKAGFVPLSLDGDASVAERAVWCELPEAEHTRLQVSSAPHVLPLLRQLELHRPGVVVVLARDRFVVYEWANGDLRETAHDEFEIDEDIEAAGAGSETVVGDERAFEHRLEQTSVTRICERLTPHLVASLYPDRDRCFWIGDPHLVESVRANVEAHLPSGIRHIDADSGTLVTAPIAEVCARVQAACEREWSAASEASREWLDSLPPTLRASGADEVLEHAQAGQVDVGFVHDAVADGELHPDWIDTLDAAISKIAQQGGTVRVLDGSGGPITVPATDETLVAAALRW